MVLIEKNFSKNKTDCVNMIKSLQKATRTHKCGTLTNHKSKFDLIIK